MLTTAYSQPSRRCMEVYTNPFLRQAIVGGTLMFGLPPEARMQYIATDDIGAFVALAFERPQEFVGKALEIAGDELTMAQTMEVFSKVMGSPICYVEMPPYDANLAKLGEWVMQVGYQADIPALRAIYPALLTMEMWLRKTGWEQAAS